MRILAFTDTHEREGIFPRLRRIVASERIDVAACVGDFTIFGRSTDAMLEEMDRLGCPVVLIHGNHEEEEEVVHALEKHENIHWAHHRPVSVGGVTFIGHGGNGFSEREAELEALADEFADAWTPSTVLLCHAPPLNTRLDELAPQWHVGSASLRSLIAKKRPMLVLCGHIHECFHERDALFGAAIINPGPDGEIVEVRG